MICTLNHEVRTKLVAFAVKNCQILKISAIARVNNFCSIAVEKRKKLLVVNSWYTSFTNLAINAFLY